MDNLFFSKRKKLNCDNVLIEVKYQKLKKMLIFTKEIKFFKNMECHEYKVLFFKETAFTAIDVLKKSPKRLK